MSVPTKRETYQEALARICELNDDELSIAKVLDEARDPASALHRHFEWDDAKAGEAYRRIQARRLIQGVRVLITETKDVVKIPRYARDPAREPGEQGYRSITSIRSVDDYRRATMAKEVTRIQANLVRAHSLAVYLGLDADTERMLTMLKDLSNKLGIVDVAPELDQEPSEN